MITADDWYKFTHSQDPLIVTKMVLEHNDLSLRLAACDQNYLPIEILLWMRRYDKRPAVQMNLERRLGHLLSLPREDFARYMDTQNDAGGHMILYSSKSLKPLMYGRKHVITK